MEYQSEKASGSSRAAIVWESKVNHEIRQAGERRECTQRK